MNSSTLIREIEQVAKDKGIERDTIIGALEEAMKQAGKKKYGLEKAIEAQLNKSSGEIELFEFREVVAEVTDTDNHITQEQARELDPEAQVGDEIGIKLNTDGFGTRILAQAVKQVIIQRVRDAERDIVFGEYKDRVHEVVNGTVKRYEKGAIVVELGRAEGVLPSKEQVSRENYRPGDRIRAYVIDVNNQTKGAQIVLSRSAVQFMTKLFTLEVPEIHEGLVNIVAAAREPGGRSKIAVVSRDGDVDPVGACVGMKGSRVQAVVQELRGERIDIVPFNEDAARYVCSALSPASISKVIIDENAKSMDVIVPDDQLSLAIGRKGQNVRLAVQLTGWQIDIKSETRMREMAAWFVRAFEVTPPWGEAEAELLLQSGVTSLEDLSQCDDALLTSIGALAEGAPAALRARAVELAAQKIEEDKARVEAEVRAREEALATAKREAEEASAAAAAAAAKTADDGGDGADGDGDADKPASAATTATSASTTPAASASTTLTVSPKSTADVEGWR